MYRRSRESWNLRNRHMFETLQALLRSRGPNSKAVVWAHNSHIGNAAATAMGWQGEFNVGELCRTAYGDEAVLIGFGTDRGTVAAASDWWSLGMLLLEQVTGGACFEGVFSTFGQQLNTSLIFKGKSDAPN